MICSKLRSDWFTTCHIKTTNIAQAFNYPVCENGRVPCKGRFAHFGVQVIFFYPHCHIFCRKSESVYYLVYYVSIMDTFPWNEIYYELYHTLCHDLVRWIPASKRTWVIYGVGLIPASKITWVIYDVGLAIKMTWSPKQVVSLPFAS